MTAVMTAVTQDVADASAGPDSAPAADLRGVAPEVLGALAGLGLEPVPGEPVVNYFGRNRNWGLSVAGGRRVFVKRLSGTAAETAARLARAVAFAEAAVQAGPRHWSAAPLLGSDAEARVLVFELVPDAVSAAERFDELDVGLARRIGRALGELHTMPAPAAAEPPRAHRMAPRLSVLAPQQYAECSGAELETWALVQHDKQLKRALAALAAASAVAAQVPSHCDLRLDQILLADGRIHLIDGEEYRAADPAADLGSLVGEWLYRAASAMFTDAGDDRSGNSAEAHEALLARGARELEVMRPLIMALWAGYRRQRPPDPGLAERATAYAGWHLFDRVFARARFAAFLGAAERGIAGIGRNALIGAADFITTIGLEDA